MTKRRGVLSICSYLVPDFPLEYFEAISHVLEEELDVFTTLQVETRWFGPPAERPDPFTYADVVFMSPAAYVGYNQGTLRGLITSGDGGSLLPVCAVHNTPHLEIDPTKDQYATVVISSDLKAKDMSEMRGTRWAYGPPSNAAAHQFTLLNLKKMGDSANFFATKVRAGCDRDALELILDKRIDGAAVDSHAYHLYCRLNPEKSKLLKPLISWGPVAAYPIVVRKDLDTEMKQDITAALFRVNACANYKKMLAPWGIVGFRENTAATYRELASQMETASHLSYDATYY